METSEVDTYILDTLDTPARICRLDLETSELRNLPIGEGEGLWGWMIIAIAIITAICQIWVSCIL